jgi:hypothetical protein
MAVVEMQKDPRSIKTVLFVAALILGFLALAGGIYWLIKPAAPRTVKLSGDQAKQATATYTPPPATLPAMPPIPTAQDPGPTLINLDLKQVTPRQAIAEIATRAKVNLNMSNMPEQGFIAALTAERLDVSYKNETFWSAVMDLCKKGKLTPYADYQQPNRISFQQGNPNFSLGPVKAVGSSVIVLEDVTSRFDADLTGPRPPSRDLRVGLKLYVEPKLSPYRIAGVATLEPATDEKGNNLIRPRQQYDDRQGGGPQSNWMRDVNCLLLFPDSAGDRIAKLKGYCSVAIAGPEKSETVKDPMSIKGAGTDVKIDNTIVRVIQIQKQGNDNYYVRMAGDTNSPVFKDYERFNKVVALIDGNGKEFQRSGGSWGGGRGNVFEFGVNFSGRGDGAMSEPKELRITLPTGIKEMRVPFEFTAVPLPH